MYQSKQLSKRGVTDAALIDELYRKHALTILRFVRRQVSSLEDAEDIVLEAFVAALQSETFQRLRENEQHAWLNRVAHNKCIDYHRIAKRRPAVYLDVVESNIYEEDEHGPDHVAVRQEEYQVLQDRLALLNDQQREILRYKFGHNMSSPEIAKLLQKSESAVRMMLYRTLSFLRDLYKQDDEGGIG